MPPSQPPSIPIPGPRIVIVGATGSGKTTTSMRLSRILGIPHIELDALHWLPNWQMVERETFRQLVIEALAGPTWITDGNYRKARDLIWERATTLIWLDYPLPVVFWQLTRRTLGRIITREELWNGNRESIRGQFFSKDSLFLWLLQSYPQQRSEYPPLLASPENAHLQVILLHSPQETNRWLAALEKQVRQ